MASGSWSRGRERPRAGEACGAWPTQGGTRHNRSASYKPCGRLGLGCGTSEDKAGPLPPPAQLREFFQASPLTRLTEAQLLDLDKPVEMDEIKQALRHLAHNKTPGGHGLPIEYYQTFSEQTLMPYLTMLQEEYELGRLSEPQREAIMVVLHKKGLDPRDV
ncbi:hypothetical protein NDU88_007862 [Pleurodeles waltl]|uniref:Uncharacterized protein n=1 Tax=Pleurodeles waltl TaxID=8319 RepID=A0AAV7NX78_PLEWA|nr:hypothetical protein NDU88_007862 [Pleurodeles waltl]